jgi:hypothetical protein
MIGKRLAAFVVFARDSGDPTQFNGKSEIDIASGTTTRVRTLVQREQGEGHFWNPPTVALIGDRAWVTPDNDPANERTAPPAPTAAHAIGAAGDDQTAVDQAVASRWMSSPANLVLLLDKATSYTEETTGTTFSFSGKAPLESLIADSGGRAFYGAYREAPKAPSRRSPSSPTRTTFRLRSVSASRSTPPRSGGTAQVRVRETPSPSPTRTGERGERSQRPELTARAATHLYRRVI